MSGMVGVTDTLDIGVAVPMVKVELDGLSWVARLPWVSSRRRARNWWRYDLRPR